MIWIIGITIVLIILGIVLYKWNKTSPADVIGAIIMLAVLSTFMSPSKKKK